MVVMLILLAGYHVWPGGGVILLPVWLAILLLMVLGLGLMAGSLMVRFRDVQHIIPTFLTLGLYISPVAWPVSAVPARYRLVYLLNPLSGLLEAFRWSLLGEGQVWRRPGLFDGDCVVDLLGRGEGLPKDGAEFRRCPLTIRRSRSAAWASRT